MDVTNSKVIGVRKPRGWKNQLAVSWSAYFRQKTEKLVNQLVKSADYAEEKLESIEEKSEHLLQGSKDIHDSLTRIDQQTHQVAQTSENVSHHITEVLIQSEVVLEESEMIAASQLELQRGQDRMRIQLDEGMTAIHDSYNNLGKKIDHLQYETVELENKISKVGESMQTKMRSLQGKADEIGKSQALEESRKFQQEAHVLNFRFAVEVANKKKLEWTEGTERRRERLVKPLQTCCAEEVAPSSRLPNEEECYV
ncbi:Protein GAMETE EXPRESSED 1 [Morella rubra]|uniref:Protein GAMETE EXPRESSED 1 n=1 Tax=Morella rubra TaxID=262757 RepID=A0A6A1WG28_9ROSI|nr:Protein GAMETE EXPRESSED 1 [Morella rubra]